MLRVHTIGARANLFGAGKPGYHYNDDIGGEPTYMGPDELNHFQEEFCAPIEEVGMVVPTDPAGADLHQLLKAINILAGKRVSTVSATAVLSAAQRGTVWVDATAGDILLTLPTADRFMDFTFVRKDATGHKVIIQCAGTEKVLHNLWVNAAGYSFFRLFGPGDFWTIRSVGAGSWLPVERLAPAPIGSPLMTTGNLVPAGGYVATHGSLLMRAEYPWLWDYAGESGNLASEADWTADQWGGYSVGDGATTFRIIELRGEFIRIWDDGRGADAGRGLGSRQKASLLVGEGTAADSVNGFAGVTDRATTNALMGMDTVDPADYTGAQSTYVYPATGSVNPITDPATGTSIGGARGRNVAMAAFLKVI